MVRALDPTGAMRVGTVCRVAWIDWWEGDEVVPPCAVIHLLNRSDSDGHNGWIADNFRHISDENDVETIARIKACKPKVGAGV